MIRKLASGKYRLYSRKKDPKTGRRRNLGTFATRAAAERHECAAQFFSAVAEKSAATIAAEGNRSTVPLVHYEDAPREVKDDIRRHQTHAQTSKM